MIERDICFLDLSHEFIDPVDITPRSDGIGSTDRYGIRLVVRPLALYVVTNTRDEIRRSQSRILRRVREDVCCKENGYCAHPFKGCCRKGDGRRSRVCSVNSTHLSRCTGVYGAPDHPIEQYVARPSDIVPSVSYAIRPRRSQDEMRRESYHPANARIGNGTKNNQSG